MPPPNYSLPLQAELPSLAHTVTTDNVQESALSWPALLSFAAIMIAGMQGTLVMESADPCRISYRKLQILMCLEVLEAIVIVCSEVFSFIQLRDALRVRLEWLQWVPPCLLIIGILELLLDIVYTIRFASDSRLKWVPFSAIGRSSKKSVTQSVDNPLPLVTTGLLSMVLIGWRQQWWWRSGVVAEEAAISRARREVSLNVGVLGFCVGWAIYLNATYVLFFGGLLKRRFKGIRNMFRPHHCDKVYFRSEKFAEIGNMELREKQCELLIQLRSGQQDCKPPKKSAIRAHLMEAPLHIGNALVGEDQVNVFKDDNETIWLSGGLWHWVFPCIEHLSILPLLVTIVVAVSRLWGSLDAQTFEALKELADAVIIVSLVEVAIGLKNLLWSTSGSGGMLNEADIPKIERDSKTGGDNSSTGEVSSA